MTCLPGEQELKLHNPKVHGWVVQPRANGHTVDGPFQLAALRGFTGECESPGSETRTSPCSAFERSPVDRRGCGRKHRYRLMSTIARQLARVNDWSFAVRPRVRTDALQSLFWVTVGNASKQAGPAFKCWGAGAILKRCCHVPATNGRRC